MNTPSIDVGCVYVFPPIAYSLIAMLTTIAKVDGCVCTWVAKDCHNSRWEVTWTLVGPPGEVAAFKEATVTVIEGGWDDLLAWLDQAEIPTENV